MILNSKFDVLRGFPKEGAIDEVFPVYQPAGVPVALIQGCVVYVRADGTVDKATTPNRTSANSIATWVVIEGNNDFSGTFTQKVVALRSNAELRIEAVNYVAGAYAVGSKVSFSAGQFTLAVATNQVIGEVLAIDAVNGTMDIFYTGGAEASF